MIHFLVVEDHALVRELIVKQLNSQPDLIVVGVAGNGQEAVSLIEAGTIPQIIITDLQMPVMDGIALIIYIVNSDLTDKNVIIYSMKDHENHKNLAINAGATDLLSKQEDFDTV